MWSCSSCGKVFENYMLMMLHRRTHSKFRPFICTFEYCTKEFRTLSELQSHARYHKDRRIYRCKICSQQFFTLRHRKLHQCHGNNLRFHRCHICAAGFTQIVSLANHIYKKHLWLFKGKHVISTKWKLPFGDGKNSQKNSHSGSGSDDSKILLKITAGKSMTIVSPSKLSSHKSKKKKHCKKKSKKKDKKESTKVNCNGIILSIKRDIISINDEKQNFNINSLQKFNGMLTSNRMLAEQKSDLKLTIKTFPEISHTPQRIDSKAYSCDSDARLISNTKIFNDEDQDAMETEDVSNKMVPTLKERNGIVISKDKLGKFLSEQLPVTKARKNDRENVFDSFKDVEIWKVMPSLPSDGPEDLLKIKLSPHKPVKIDQMTDEVSVYDRLKCLGIPSKVKDGISGEDSDVLDLLQVDEKESDVGINNVNDSGIEVLSSSSCNRSNGNSVRSVVFDENSPTYLNTEDSLLSLDSPFMEGLSKAEHSICNRCGGIILEQNNNTHSPGKCRCGSSGLNSPFHPPVSPSKTFSNLSETSKTQKKTIESHVIVDDTEHIANTSLNPSVGSKTEVVSDNENSLPFDVLQIDQSDSDNSDILLISVENNKKSLKGTVHKDSERNKLNCCLKLEKKDSKISAEKAFNKECNSCNSLEHVQTFNVNIVMPPHLSIEKNLCAITSCTSSNVCELNVSMNSCISPIIVTDDQDNGENMENKHLSSSEPVTRKHDASKLLQKRPLFINEQPESDSVTSNNKSVNQDFSEYGFVNKKSLFRKRPSFDDTEYGGSKPPLFKRHKSAPGCCGSDLIKTDTRKENKIEKWDDILEDPSIVSLVSENDEQAKYTENMLLFDESLVSCLQDKVCESEKQTDTSFSMYLADKVNDTKQMKDSCAYAFENCEKISNTVVDDNAVLCGVDDDSLQQLPEITNNGTEAVTTKTKSGSDCMDLFQHQFLSFISGNNQSKEKKLAQSRNKLVKKGSQLNGNTNDNVIDLTKCKQSEKVEVTKLTSPARKDKTSDSSAWLRIFSEKTKIDKVDIEKKTEKPKDGIMDIGLAAMNMKIVNSEGEETRSLDIDDLFKLQKFPNVEPKSDISTEDHGRIQKIQSEINLSCENSAAAQPRRRQVAKRTGMKVQSKKTMHHENDYKCLDSASSADTIDLVSHYGEVHYPDFNPFNDPDEVFVSVDHHTKNLSHACSEVKRKSIEISSGSDDEVRSDSDIDGKCDPQSTAHSRKNRTKKGRRSSCPCCMGSQKLNTKEHIVEHRQNQNYRLSRNHKQFIKNTLKLLALQEKLHLLFLNLFPACIDRLNKPKVGTDEFEALIEDILYGLEDKSTELPTVFPSINVTVQGPLTNSDYNSCPVDISMSGSDISQTNGINFVCLNDGSLTSTNKETSLLNTSVMYQSSFNDLRYVPTSIFNNTRTCSKDLCTSQNSGSHKSESLLSSANSDLICLSESSNNLKFEYNTLTGSPDRNFLPDHTHLSYSKCSLDQHGVDIAETASNNIMPSVVTQGNGATIGLDISPSIKNDGDINLASSICISPSNIPTSIISSEPYCDNTTFEQTVDSVQSELVITIDLSAARVSLCRNPKNCLNWLQNKIIRLTQCLLPRIFLKKYIYKNIDNLEFMLDLLIEANSSGNQISSKEQDLEAGFSYNVWNVPNYGIIQTLLVPTGISVEDMNLNTVLPETENNLDVETLFVNCFDFNTFEQEIKLQRELLKKDLFQVGEDKPELMFKYTDDIQSNSEQVLHSIQSLSKIALRNHKSRPRDSRHRKKNADDKRTLFVQEKLKSQSSNIFHRPRKHSKTIQKSTGKCSLSEDSKTTFLSQFNLGDKCETSISSQVVNKNPSLDAVNNNFSYRNPKNVTSVDGTHRVKKIWERSVTKANADSADARIENGTEHSESFAENIDTESENHLRLGEKNIFELMQPC